MLEKLITPQDAASIVTLEEIKAQCRIDADISDDDSLLTLYLQAAVESCQHELGRPILPQVWEREFDDPSLQPLCLRQDVTAISKLTAITAAAEIDLAGDAWRLAKGCRVIAVSGWPCGTRLVRVRFTCAAWSDAASVPQPIKLWIMQRIATAYANREAFSSGLPLSALPRTFVDGLLDPYRSWR